MSVFEKMPIGDLKEIKEDIEETIKRKAIFSSGLIKKHGAIADCKDMQLIEDRSEYDFVTWFTENKLKTDGYLHISLPEYVFEVLNHYDKDFKVYLFAETDINYCIIGNCIAVQIHKDAESYFRGEFNAHIAQNKR